MKIAFTGCAHIHMPGFVRMTKQEPGITVAGVWDKDPQRAGKYAKELNAPVLPEEEIWRDPSIKGVVIASETIDHENLIRKAAESGKAVYAEKPLGFHGSDAMRSAELLAEKKLLFQTGYFNRGRAVYLCLKKLIAEGAFGMITRMRHTNVHAGLFDGYFDGEWRWMADPASAGCGAFGDMGTHSLDLVMWFLGKPCRVSGSVRTLTGKYGNACDEYGEALLEFPSGALATIAAGWVDRWNPVTCEISGTEGYACIFNRNLYIRSPKIPGAGGETPWKDLPEELPHAFTLYLQALQGRCVPLVTPAEAAERSVVMDAVYQSSINHAPVFL